MVSQQEGASFFSRLLQGLLANLQPQAGLTGEPQRPSPLQSAAKDVLAATCQLLGTDSFLQQVLQSVEGLGDAAKPINASQLEVGYCSVALFKCLQSAAQGKLLATCCILGCEWLLQQVL